MIGIALLIGGIVGFIVGSVFTGAVNRRRIDNLNRRIEALSQLIERGDYFA